MELYQHQKDILERNPSKHLLAFDTGTGKTITSMELSYQNKCSSILVICPKALKEKWKRDWKNWREEKIKTHQKTKGSVLIHEPKIVSKEEFKKFKLELGYFEAVIIDEGHYFAGMKSQMSKDLRWYLKKYEVPFVWILTATPYMSSPWNIYTLAGHLGYKWSYITFKDKFFDFRYVGRREVPVVKQGIEPEIARLVNKIGTTVRIDECADIPEQVFETEYFKLTQSQKKIIGEVDFQEINPIVRFTKFHQIENGTLKTDGYTKNSFIDSDKTIRVLELAEQHKKIAIVCRYNLQIELYKAELGQLKKNIFVIQGETKDKDKIVQQINKEDECVVLINAACSEGYELPSVGVCVFASLSFSYKDYKQLCGRFLRINKLKKNVYIHLVTSGSVDEAVYNAIMKKQDFHMEIFADEYKDERSGLSNSIHEMA